MQLSEVNQPLWAELTTVGITENTPAWHGVRRALGVGPGENGDAQTHPVYAFTVASLSVSAENPNLVLFLVTGGRLIRYEWSKAAAATTTIPLDRVCGVDELESATEYAVAIHVDGHTRLHAAHSETRTMHSDSPDAPAQVTTTTERSEGLTYRIAVTTETAAVLAEFSRRLRLLLGV